MAQRDVSHGEPLGVLIVDDHILIRRAIRSVLDGYPDLQVVGEASDGIEAIVFVENHHPPVVLMDINMPKMDGIEASVQIMNRYPNTIIVGLSVNTGVENEKAMKRAGAVRLIPKEAANEHLYDAIRDAVTKRA
jgi:DNA-binding NarL/FixJ family response regulator